jgi:hypothetical protein
VVTVSDAVGSIDLLHYSPLEEVLLILDNYASLGHEDRVGAHVFKVDRAVFSLYNWLLSVLIVDPDMSALCPRVLSCQAARLSMDWFTQNVRAVLALMDGG